MTTEIFTTTLPTGETILAKSPTEPLRYGNTTSAQKKLDSISHVLSANHRSASIVKQDGRFLIFIYDAPGYQSISHDSVERMMRRANADLNYKGPRDPFATVSGARHNPRNRHNHNHKDQTDQPHYLGG